MQFVCRHCTNLFDKELTFKQKIEKYIPKFCSHDCEKNGVVLKNKKRFVKRTKMSKEEIEFGNILAKFYGGLRRQYKLENYYHNFDFFCPELGILIEYDGFFFHSKPKAKLRDMQHNLEAKKRNIPISRITDIEWKQVLKEGSLTRDKLVKVIRKNIID